MGELRETATGEVVFEIAALPLEEFGCSEIIASKPGVTHKEPLL